jgi:hypothetical protein
MADGSIAFLFTGKEPKEEISHENNGLRNNSSLAIKFNSRGQAAPKTMGSK